MTHLKIKPGEAVPGQELVITRIFHASRELVFRAWTDPRHLAQWWGPRGFTNPACELDVRPGGALYIQMRAPDGSLYPAQGVFREIVPPERLVFTTFAYEDQHGQPQLEVLHTVTFVDLGGKTELTLRARVIRATPAVAEALAGMEPGWNEGLEKLAEFLEG